MRIALTQEDLDLGLRGSSFACPWSRALSRLMPRRELLCGSKWISDGDGDVLFILPLAVQAWIAIYDVFGETDGWEALNFNLPDRLGKPG